MTPQLLISFQFVYDQPITFWAVPIPRENTPDWVKISEFFLEKDPTLGSKIGPLFWSLVYPKYSKLEVYNPRVMILGFFSIIYKSNDPQIFHLHNKLWGLQIIHEAWRMLWDYLVVCTQMESDKTKRLRMDDIPTWPGSSRYVIQTSTLWLVHSQITNKMYLPLTRMLIINLLSLPHAITFRPIRLY